MTNSVSLPSHLPSPEARRHHSLFLSDLHLGAFGARADLALDFLHQNVAETYVLVGDILDIGNPLFSHWDASHQAVLDHLRARKAAGATLVYVRGNHDPDTVGVPDSKLVPAAPLDRAEHQMADGRRFLVIHGDILDARLFQGHLMTRIGSHVDQTLRYLDRVIKGRFFRAGPQRRSVIEFALSWINWGLYAGRSHERRLVAMARHGGYDGVICGHFHMADLHDRHGLIYANCGDWMDSFTALAADHQGGLHLLGGRKHFETRARPGTEAGLVTR